MWTEKEKFFDDKIMEEKTVSFLPKYLFTH